MAACSSNSTRVSGCERSPRQRPSMGNWVLPSEIPRSRLGLRRVRRFRGSAMLRLAWVVIAAFMVMTRAAGAAPSDDAFAAYQKGDYKTALALMRPLAEKGDVNAQYNLGAMYANSLGVSQDHKEAAKWVTLAADNGNVCAVVDLAVLYQNGQGVAT